MLSTTNSNLHARQRQHRRQNSTPTAFEAVKIAQLPRFPNQHTSHSQQNQQRSSHLSSHRRGLSLDTIRQRLSPPTPRTPRRQQQQQQHEGYTAVSTSIKTAPTNSTGPATTTTTQQNQRIAARPGRGANFIGTDDNSNSRNNDNENNFLLSPHPTPQTRRFIDVLPGSNPSHIPETPSMAFDGFSNTPGSRLSGMSTATFGGFPADDDDNLDMEGGWMSEGAETTGSGTIREKRRTSRRISNGIMDRVAKFENMGHGLDGKPSGGPVQRPVTPPQQNMNTYLPPTPMETPHDRMSKHAPPRPNRFSDDYDESMEETVKPVRGRRSGTQQRASDVFREMREQAEAMMQRSQRPSTMSVGGYPTSAPDFMDMNNLSSEFVKIEHQHAFDGIPTSNATTALEMTPPELCQQASPMTPNMAGFGGFTGLSGFGAGSFGGFSGVDFDSQIAAMAMQSSQPQSQSHSPASHRSSDNHHRRTESLASIASAASIASINIEETKTETGVTGEDIAAFIEGPDPRDGKWTCLYERCGKKFGRKENIKSHVQTHLNDRQYRCPTCQKCFVRQHDLKRHAKIHTGIKPYPCECGNSFARHDALTRHRQRGMCIGAFDGIVRKVVKRGRPRKHRPGMDERRDKRERTRRKNTASSGASDKSGSCSPSHSPSPSFNTSPGSATSHSGYSDSSGANSPMEIMDDFDGVLDNRAFPDMMRATMGGPGPDSASMDIPTSSATMNPTDLSVSSAPMPTTCLETGIDLADAFEGVVVTPDQIHSPSAASNYSHISQASIGGGECNDTADCPSLPAHHHHPASPAKSTTSHYTQQPGTPPGLSASSSPPATGSTARFFDLDPDSSGLSSASLGLGLGLGGSSVGGPGIQSLEDEMLLFASGEGGLVQLDRSDMMLGAKFDDEYDAVAMFTNGDDVFFGSA